MVGSKAEKEWQPSPWPKRAVWRRECQQTLLGHCGTKELLHITQMSLLKPHFLTLENSKADMEPRGGEAPPGRAVSIEGDAAT